MAAVPWRIFAFIQVLIVGVLVTASARASDAVPSTPGAKFRECAHDCPEMIVVPAGSFTMGTDRRDIDPQSREGPPHRVTFQKPFALGIYDVTRREYIRFVRETGRRVTQGCNVVDSEGRWITDPGKTWRDPGFKQTDRDPVVCVSWEDAQAYTRWLNSKLHGAQNIGGTLGPYRLPSEAEWEYAARAGSSTYYYWGEVASHDHANYGIEHCSPCGAAKGGKDHWYFTSPVGSFPPNPFGLYDASGNVWQWTADCMHYSFANAPSDGSAWTTDTSDACHNRILRGGSWLDPSRLVMPFERNPWAPKDHNYANGFRVARTLE
jgi:sulfatase modifying factor 1